MSPRTNDRRGEIGTVTTETVKIELPPEGLRLESGATLPELHVAYETYGRLARASDNVVYICHALTGDAHVAGYHADAEDPAGWWNEMVGPGRGIDTEYYYVVCANILGGCEGTTGPASPKPGTGRCYGAEFPPITIGDIVHVQYLLLRQLGIERLAAVIGGSLGGMQVLEWSIRYPDKVDRCICIAAAANLSTQALAFDVVGRDVITSDPAWQGGDYYDSDTRPETGLAQARMLGHITYLSPEMMKSKFGRARQDGPAELADFQTGFQVESYLEHQGRKFVNRFDANSYLHITRAMDCYDLVEQYGSLEKAFLPATAKFLIVALDADWLFPPAQSVEIAGALVRAGKQVSYCMLTAPHGHDAFLVDIHHLQEVVRAFLPWVHHGSDAADGGVRPLAPRPERKDFELIKSMVTPGSRVLDLGCGDGTLLGMLADERAVDGFGIDIDLQHVIEAIDRGVDLFQGDLDEGLALFPDNAYDYAVLGQTLQVVRKPRLVLRETLRVAHQGIITIPNMAKWSHRFRLGLLGKMPKSPSLPFEWYDTPNIHLTTVNDFLALCRKECIEIADMICIPEHWLDKGLIRLGFCALGADRVLVRIARRAPGRLPNGATPACRQRGGA